MCIMAKNRCLSLLVRWSAGLLGHWSADWIVKLVKLGENPNDASIKQKTSRLKFRANT